MKSYGFREEILRELSSLNLRVILARADEELLAIPEGDVREILYQPSVTPWIQGSPAVAVLIVRGNAYALTDPLNRGKIRRIALALAIRSRYLAIGVDELRGVVEGKESDRRELTGARYPWAREVLQLPQGPALYLDPEGYIQALDSLR
jgi:chemotaxis signal transduction protein